MSLLTMVVQQEEGIVYLNTDSFLDTLACCKYNEILSFNRVSFSSTHAHFVYVLHSGRHVSDSCNIDDYLKWKETL